MKSEEIATELRERIEQGRRPGDQLPEGALEVGDVVPTADQLAAQYGVNRNTAHQALLLLKGAGLIHSRKGRISVVADPSPLYVIHSDAYDRALVAKKPAWEHQQAEAGQAPRTDQHTGDLSTGADWGIDGGGETVADLLEVEEGTELVHLAGEGWSTPIGSDGQPDEKLAHVVQIYDGWFASDLLERVPKLLQPRDADWQAGVFGIISDYDGRFPQPDPDRIITERITTADEAARFRVPPLSLITAEVEISRDQYGELLCVIWYRRLFGVAQWRLRKIQP